MWPSRPTLAQTLSSYLRLVCFAVELCRWQHRLTHHSQPAVFTRVCVSAVLLQSSCRRWFLKRHWLNICLLFVKISPVFVERAAAVQSEGVMTPQWGILDSEPRVCVQVRGFSSWRIDLRLGGVCVSVFSSGGQLQHLSSTVVSWYWCTRQCFHLYIIPEIVNFWRCDVYTTDTLQA